LDFHPGGYHELLFPIDVFQSRKPSQPDIGKAGSRIRLPALVQREFLDIAG